MIGIIGAPGAGKNTQTELLADYLNCPWFSQGMLIRQYATGQARQDMLDGKIIDDSVTLGLLDKALTKIDTKEGEFIIEGGPRTLIQAKWWQTKLASGAKITGIIHLMISEKIAHQRLIKRGRLDDQKAVIAKRLSEYRANTKQALEYLETKGFPLYNIDADGSPKEVNSLILQALGLNVSGGVKTR